MVQRKKIIVIFGTRPEAIKMAPVFFKLKEQSSFEVVSVYSGQHENLIHNAVEAFNWEPDVSLKPKLAGSNVSKLVVELQTQIIIHTP